MIGVLNRFFVVVALVCEYVYVNHTSCYIYFLIIPFLPCCCSVPSLYNLHRVFAQLSKTSEADDFYNRARYMYNSKLLIDGAIDTLVHRSYVKDLLVIPPNLVTQYIR